MSQPTNLPTVGAHDEAMVALEDKISDLLDTLSDDERQCSVYALSRLLGIVLAMHSNDQDHLTLGIKGIQKLVRRDALDAWASLAEV